MRFVKWLPLALVAVLVPGTAARAQNTTPRTMTNPPNTGTSLFPPPLYREPGISQSLRLTPEQVTRLNEANQRIQANYQRDIERLSTLNDRDRAARTQELMRNYNRDWVNATRGIFNNNQAQRYRELYLQYEGFNAFHDPDVRTQLGLTQQQIAQLQEAKAWREQQLQALNTQARTNPQQAREAWNQYLTQSQERLNRILTPAQQRTWQQMTGQTYTFQPPFVPLPGTEQNAQPNRERP